MMSQPPRSPQVDSLDDNNKCSICQESFTVNPEEGLMLVRPCALVKRARLMPEVDVAVCGHIFHKFCIHRWLKTGGKDCPLCRKKTTKKGLRRIFNFPLPSQQQQEGRYWRIYEGKNGDVDEMNLKLGEEKKKVDDMVKHLVEEMEGVKRELQWKIEGKGKHVEELKKRVEWMEGMLKEKGKEVKELEGTLKEKENEVEELRERLKGMEGTLKERTKEVKKLQENAEEVEKEREWDRFEYRLKLGRMARNYEVATDKMREDFEEGKKSGERLMEMQEEDLQKAMKLNGELEEELKTEKKKLRVEKEKNKFAKERFVERMKKRVNEEYERLKMEKERREGVDWEKMYKLCRMERDKERGRATYYEKRCKRLSGITETYATKIADLTEIMRRKLNGDEDTLTTNLQVETSSKITCEKGHVDLFQDLDISESEDDDKEEHLKGSGFTLEGYLSSSEEDSDSDDNNASDSSSSSDEGNVD